MILNNAFLLLSTFTILTVSTYAAGPIPDDCELMQEQEFGAIGDTSGKDIYTKIEYTYECTTITEKNGECIEWRHESNRHMELPEDRPVVFKDEDFSGGLGQLALIFAGYSQIDHIWSGWKGLCYDGVVEDFSWMSDPVMWASLIAQGMGVEGVEELSEYAGYAQCAVQMGASIGQAVNNYTQDEIPCDPIDEFCGSENDASDENVMSVTREAYEKLVSEDPEFDKYIEIVKDQGEILIVKIIQPQEDLSSKTAEEAAEAMKKMKQIMLGIETAFIAYDAYTCFSSASEGETQAVAGSTANSGSAVQDAVTGVVSRAIAATGCVPCSIAFTLAVNLVNSFNDVDSCNDKDDAQEQGSRHIATYGHKKEGMCHFIRKETEEGTFADLDKYFYCCYDDVFSRILAEQFKAQYAKNWNSCSDVTLNEIIHLNMSPCKEGMSGVDPSTIPWNATDQERQQTIQYKNKCIDFTEMQEYLSEKFNANIDEGMIYEQLEDMQENIQE